MKFHLPLFCTIILHALRVAASQFDVIIVGAGAAGLSAARALLERNDPPSTITILEATDRIGGRVRSAQLGDTRVEMGAEEHYGAEGGNPVHQALTAVHPGIYLEGFASSRLYAMPPDPLDGAAPDVASPKGTCGTVTYGDGAGLTRNCAEDKAWEKYTELYSWYWRRATFKGSKSSRSYEYELSKSSKFFRGIRNYDETRGWFLYSNEFGAEYGTTVDEMGAHDTAISDYQWPLSELVYVNTNNLGYSDLLNDILWNETISADAVTLKLNSPVTGINATGASGRVEVTANGGPYYADRVIVTVPIGVLKASIGSELQPGESGHISFSPELPGDTKQAITDIGYDRIVKAALKFDRNLTTCGNSSHPWWEDAVGGEVGVMITNGASGGWAWPANYKNGSRDDVLMTFIAGRKAKELSELSDTDLIYQILSDLDNMFNGTPASDCFANDTANYAIRDWGKSPYQRGAYSFQTPATVDDDGGAYAGNARVRLQAPVFNDRVFFAGEGTSLTMMATVPGAVFEGERVGYAVGSVCGSVGRKKRCRRSGSCVWSRGECVPAVPGVAGSSLFVRRRAEKNIFGSIEKASGATADNARDGGKMERGGKNRIADYRGEDLIMAAKMTKRL